MFYVAQGCFDDTHVQVNIAGGEDIVIHTPDELDMQREEAYAVALIQLQEKIADGVYPIKQ